MKKDLIIINLRYDRKEISKKLKGIGVELDLGFIDDLEGYIELIYLQRDTLEVMYGFTYHSHIVPLKFEGRRCLTKRLFTHNPPFDSNKIHTEHDIDYHNYPYNHELLRGAVTVTYSISIFPTIPFIDSTFEERLEAYNELMRLFNNFIKSELNNFNPLIHHEQVLYAVKHNRENKTFNQNKEKESIKLNFDLDLILDKISEYGVGSLTKEEKEFLDNKSK